MRRRVIRETMPDLAPEEAATLTAILERALENAAELPARRHRLPVVRQGPLPA